MKKIELVKKAQCLYSLGKEAEKARLALKELTEKGVSYESDEMISAILRFQSLQFQWDTLEKGIFGATGRVKIGLFPT